LKSILLIFFITVIRLQATDINTFERYLFLASPADSAIVKYLYRVVVDNESEYKEVFHDSLQQRLTICLPKSDQEYLEQIGGGIPDWSGGVADPDQHLIVLRPGAYFDPREYREVLLHELAHIYLAAKVDTSQIPLWFNEGVAMMMSGKTFSWNDHVVISNAVIANKLLELGEVEKMLGFGLAKAQLAYAQSLMAVQFLRFRFGEKIISKLLDGLAEGESWEEIFNRYTGRDTDQFSLELQNYIRQEYRWAYVLQIKYLFWIIVAILLTAGFVAIKIRNHRLLKEWEKNESI
jgi:Peptidase MA superfamily